MSRYDIDKFETPPDPDLVCCICQCVLDNPVESPCRHVFCKICIETWLNNNSSCPACRRSTRTNSLRPVLPLVQNMLNRLLMFCDFKDNGCEEKIMLEHYISHTKTCGYEMVVCRYPKCAKCMLRLHIENHEENECSEREKLCEKQCGLMIPLSIFDTHDCIEELRNFARERDDLVQKLKNKVDELSKKTDKLNKQIESLRKELSRRSRTPSTTSFSSDDNDYLTDSSYQENDDNIVNILDDNNDNDNPFNSLLQSLLDVPDNNNEEGEGHSGGQGRDDHTETEAVSFDDIDLDDNDDVQILEESDGGEHQESDEEYDNVYDTEQNSDQNDYHSANGDDNESNVAEFSNNDTDNDSDNDGRHSDTTSHATSMVDLTDENSVQSIGSDDNNTSLQSAANSVSDISTLSENSDVDERNSVHSLDGENESERDQSTDESIEGERDQSTDDEMGQSLNGESEDERNHHSADSESIQHDSSSEDSNHSIKSYTGNEDNVSESSSHLPSPYSHTDISDDNSGDSDKESGRFKGNNSNNTTKIMNVDNSSDVIYDEEEDRGNSLDDNGCTSSDEESKNSDSSAQSVKSLHESSDSATDSNTVLDLHSSHSEKENEDGMEEYNDSNKTKSKPCSQTRSHNRKFRHVSTFDRKFSQSDSGIGGCSPSTSSGMSESSQNSVNKVSGMKRKRPVVHDSDSENSDCDQNIVRKKICRRRNNKPGTQLTCRRNDKTSTVTRSAAECNTVQTSATAHHRYATRSNTQIFSHDSGSSQTPWYERIYGSDSDTSWEPDSSIQHDSFDDTLSSEEEIESDDSYEVHIPKSANDLLNEYASSDSDDSYVPE